jgi:hypothetical protein
VLTLGLTRRSPGTNARPAAFYISPERLLPAGRHFQVSGGITVTKTTRTVESAGGTFHIWHVFPPIGGQRVLPDTAPRCLA